MKSKQQYPYLFICDRNLEPMHYIALSKIKNIEEILRSLDCRGAIGILSNYKKPFEAQFKRSRKEADPQESELIALADRPKRLATDELIQFLESIQLRGKDKRKRKMHLNSIKNLKKAPEWSSNNMPRKPCQISDDQILEAIRLKSLGFSWKILSEKLEINVNSLRSAISRFKLRNKDEADGIEGSSQIYEEFQAKNNAKNHELRA